MRVDFCEQSTRTVSQQTRQVGPVINVGNGNDFLARERFAELRDETHADSVSEMRDHRVLKFEGLSLLRRGSDLKNKLLAGVRSEVKVLISLAG